jgi:hypothetical protein
LGFWTLSIILYSNRPKEHNVSEEGYFYPQVRGGGTNSNGPSSVGVSLIILQLKRKGLVFTFDYACDFHFSLWQKCNEDSVNSFVARLNTVVLNLKKGRRNGL